jgi:hypothetical protein
LAPGDAVQIGEPRAADGDRRITATIEHCWLAPPSAITHLGAGHHVPSTTVHAHDMPMTDLTSASARCCRTLHSKQPAEAPMTSTLVGTLLTLLEG